jgi:NADPH:quinone reductase-like Zn-dependent oxidoreductase
MRAVGVSTWGGPEVLHVVDLPDPEAGPGEVRIRVRAAAINPTDTQLRSGQRAERLKDVPPPHVPGMDAAGVLEQVGEGASTDVRVGERVMAIVLPLGPHGAYAERVVVPASSVARSPAGASDAEAATLPMNGLTARLALDALALRPGRTLAVTGAAGAVGGYVVQLGTAEGLTVLADAARADEPLVRALGADTVVPRGEGFAARVRTLVPAGVDGLVDAALLGAGAVDAVRDAGRVVSLRGYDGGAAAHRGITFHPVYVRNYAHEREKLDQLRAQAEDGTLALRVARTFPVEQAAEAHRLLEAGGVRGRLVLEF